MKVQKKNFLRFFCDFFFPDATTSNFIFKFLKQLFLDFIWVARFMINNVKIKPNNCFFISKNWKIAHGGVSFLYTANTLFTKLAWILAIITMTAVGAVFLIKNTLAYSESKLITTIESSAANLSVSNVWFKKKLWQSTVLYHYCGLWIF